MKEKFELAYHGGYIKDTQTLAKALGTDPAKLSDLATSPSYRSSCVYKPSGEERELTIPDNSLKIIQRRIVGRIFSEVRFPDYLYGGVKDSKLPRDYIKCAERHCNAGAFSSEDIKSFFDNISEGHANKIFKHLFKFPDEVSDALTRLVIYNDMLPQGAPTSSGIANMVFFRQEPDIVKEFSDKEVTYTRFVDDIVISHPNPDFSLERFRKKVLAMLNKEGFSANPEKTVRKQRNSQPLVVMGVKVNFRNPRLPSDEKKRIRAAVGDIEKKSKVPNARKTQEYHRLWHRTSGRLNKLQRLGYGSYKRLRARMRRVMPLVADHEPRKLREIVADLESTSINGFEDEKNFCRRIHRVRNRIGILGRTHPNLASDLNARTMAILRAL